MLLLSFPQAFAAWLRLASGVSAQDLANQPLTKAALDGLNEQTTFDAAVDAVCELIRYTVSGSGLGDIVAHMPLVQVRERRETPGHGGKTLGAVEGSRSNRRPHVCILTLCWQKCSRC
jgi:hypothetical protein